MALDKVRAEVLTVHDPGILMLTGEPESKPKPLWITWWRLTPVPDVGTGCRYLQLDLSSLTSIRTAAPKVLEYPDVPKIDVAICSAVVMWIAEYQESADDIEIPFAPNHVGHFSSISFWRS